MLDRETALAAASTVASRLRGRAEATETARRLPDETVNELRDAGLFGITRPKMFGGSQLGFTSLVEVASTLAQECGSTGWVFGVLSGHSWILSLFSAAAQQEALSDPRALTATVFRLNGEVTREDDGYRLRAGEGRFCSGVDFASWVIVGTRVRDRNGLPEAGFFLIPIADVEIIDDWHTMGMRGTGSRTIRVKDAYIPSHRFLSMKDISEGRAPGVALHGDAALRVSGLFIQGFSLIGAPLGLASGFVRRLAREIGAKSGAGSAPGPGPGIDLGAVADRIARAAVDVDAAYELIMAQCRRFDTEPDVKGLGERHALRLSRDMAYAANQCRAAVNSLFEAAGGSSIYNESGPQRAWRDINSAANHFGFTWDIFGPAYGKALMGLSNNAGAA